MLLKVYLRIYAVMITQQCQIHFTSLRRARLTPSLDDTIVLVLCTRQLKV